MQRSMHGTRFGWLLGSLVLLAGPLAGLRAQGLSATAPANTAPASSWPIGSSLRCWTAMQVNRAAADEYVIYKCEWRLNDIWPSQAGIAHLERIARRIQNTSFCVVVQPEGSIELNNLRRIQVVNYLAARGVVDAVHRVTLAHPEAEGLAGDEAERIFLQQPHSSH